MGVKQAAQIREDIDTGRLTNLSNCLSTITMNSSSAKPSITLLPNLIKSVVDYALERKKLNIIEKRDQKIYNLYNKDLDLREKQNDQMHEQIMQQQAFHYKEKMAELLCERDEAFREINADKEVALSKIAEEEKVEIKRIESEAAFKSEALRTAAEIRIKEMDNAKEKFMASLKESARKFDQQMRVLQHDQKQRKKLYREILFMCEQIRKECKNGRLDPSYIALIQIAADAQRENFQIIETLNRVFAPSK